MTSLITEFNEIINNYIDLCISRGERIDTLKDSFELTPGKVKTIYNQLIKEKVHEKESDDFKEILQDFKDNVGYFSLEEHAKLPNYEDKIVEFTKNCIFDYQHSKENFITRSYKLGMALTHLKLKYQYRRWEDVSQEFFRKNNLKMSSSTEKSLRKFAADIGPYHKLLFVKKNFTELKRMLPKILDGLELYPHEKEFWTCPENYVCGACVVL